MLVEESKKKNDDEQNPPPLTKAQKNKMKLLQKKQEREALILKISRGEVQREIDLAKKIYRTAEKKWKELCVIKGKSVYKDLMMEQWCLFEHHISIKDDMIHHLLKEIETAETNRERQFQNFYHEVDNCIKNFLNSIEEMKYKMTIEKEQLLNEREISLNCLKEKYQDMGTYINTIQYIDRKNAEEKEIFWKSKFVFAEDEEIDKNQSEYEQLCALLEVQLQNIWQNYTEFLEEYNSEVHKMFNEIKYVEKRVRQEDDIIINQVKKRLLLEKMIEKFNEKNENSDPLMIEIEALRNEKRNLIKLYQKEKTLIADRQKTAKIKLTELVSKSNDSLKYLENKCKLGETIHKLHQISASLETITKEENVRKSITRHSPTINVVTVTEAMYKLVKFRKRIGYAEMTTNYLKYYRKTLSEENKKLKKQVQNVINSREMPKITNHLVKCTKNF